MPSSTTTLPTSIRRSALGWLAIRAETFHFTPTSSSWLNAVEGFFAKLTKRRPKRGVFRSIVDLQAGINRFLAEHNDHPRPFVWNAEPNRIIAAVKRGHQVLDSVHYDSEAGKGDDKHIGGHQTSYMFTTPAQLLNDFWNDVEGWRAP